jgi:hypothetical protein
MPKRKEDLTYILRLDQWTSKEDNVPTTTATGEAAKPAFIPADEYDGAKKEYVYVWFWKATEGTTGYYHLSTKEAWQALAASASGSEHESEECFYNFLPFTVCSVCLPCFTYYWCKNIKDLEYKELTQRRVEMEVPTGVPDYKQKKKKLERLYHTPLDRSAHHAHGAGVTCEPASFMLVVYLMFERFVLPIHSWACWFWMAKGLSPDCLRQQQVGKPCGPRHSTRSPPL